MNVATQLGKQGINVGQLDTIDPVLIFGGSLSKPSNVDNDANYYETNGGVESIFPWSVGNFAGTPVSGASPNQNQSIAFPSLTHQGIPFGSDQAPGGVFYDALGDLAGH